MKLKMLIWIASISILSSTVAKEYPAQLDRPFGKSGNCNIIRMVDGDTRILSHRQKLEAVVCIDGLDVISLSENSSRIDSFHIKVESIGRKGKVSSVSRGFIYSDDSIAYLCRDGLTEEFRTDSNGIRQDFLIQSAPGGTEPLTLILNISGARVIKHHAGALVRLNHGRDLAYSKLYVNDAKGRRLPAKMIVLNDSKIALEVSDKNAVYPIRIDPTFSDADWVSMGALSGVNGWVSSMAIDKDGNLYVGGDLTVAGSIISNKVVKWDGTAWSALGSGLNNEVLALACDSSGNLYAGGQFDSAGEVRVNHIAKWNGTAWSALGSGLFTGNGQAPVARAIACDASGNVYVGGYFAAAGDNVPNTWNIAIWDGSQWSALGTGLNATVRALNVDNDGNLYAGGDFSYSGSVELKQIGKWDGTAWSALGAGLTSTVYAIACDNSGNVYAGGHFRKVDMSGIANFIAKWNGTSWNPFSSEVDSTVHTLALDNDGNLVAGGFFKTAGGSTVNGIARWDGSSWNGYGDGLSSYSWAVACGKDGTVYTGGDFIYAGNTNASHVAQWKINQWSAIGGDGEITGVNSEAYCIGQDTNGDIYLGGEFTHAGSNTASNIARWNGVSWSGVGSGTNGGVHEIKSDGKGSMYIAGKFTTAGGVLVNHIARWNGTAWSSLGSGTDSYTYSLLFDKSGNLYAAGYFTTAGSVSADYIAKWNGSSWSAVCPVMKSSVVGVISIAIDSSGNIYATGVDTAGVGDPTCIIGKWDGSTWTILASGLNNVHTLYCDPGNNLYVGGSFSYAATTNIMKWNGTSWEKLGAGLQGGTPFPVRGIAINGAGNVFVAGGYLFGADENYIYGTASHNIAKFDGVSWYGLGSGLGIKEPQGYANEILYDYSKNTLYVCGNITVIGDKVSAYVGKWVDTIPPPQMPQLKSPEDSDTGISLAPELQWYKALGATVYQFQLSTNSSFSPVSKDTLINIDTSIDISGLQNNTTYYWRVKAINSSGASTWSSGRSFTTSPAAPVLDSPGNNTVWAELSPNLMWTYTSAATKYQLQVSIDQNFTTIIKDTILPKNCTYIPMNNLTGGTRYYWRLRLSALGGTSQWSAVWNFKTRLPIPVTISPVNNSTNIPVNTTLIWKKVAGASSYEVKIVFGSTVVKDTSVVDTSLIISGLAFNTQYQWQVNCSSTEGTTLWSFSSKFTTALPPSAQIPLTILPASGATDIPLSTKLTWSRGIDAISYQVQVLDGNWHEMVKFDSSLITDTTVVVSGLSPSATYVWKVRATNQYGPGEWSPLSSFTTIPPVPYAPYPQYPENDSRNMPLSLTLSWRKVLGADSYRIQVSNVMDFSSLIKDSAGVIDTTFNIMNLGNDLTVYWRVCATNIAGTGLWSDTLTFRTIVALPETVSVLLPADSAFTNLEYMTFAWNKGIRSVSEYAIEIATDSAMTNIFRQDTLEDTTFEIYGIEINQTYWWRIKAKNIAGWGPYGKKRCFVRMPSTPVIPKQFELKSLGMNGSTHVIRYALPKRCKVNISFYDLRGRLVTSLINQEKAAGYYTIKIPTFQFAKGTYVQVFQAGTFVKRKSISIVK